MIRCSELGEGTLLGDRNLKLRPEQEKIHELEKKLKDAELERDILKNSLYLLQERLMKYKFIKNNESIFSIEKRCNVLKLNSNGYYGWKDKSRSK